MFERLTENMKLSLIVLFTVTCVVLANAQSITPQVLSSGGGDNSNTNVGLSWTVGEPVIQTAVGASASVTQGFHQIHFEIISIEEHRELGYEVSVYPNPSTDIINIRLKFIGKGSTPSGTKFNVVLTDNSGKILISNKLKNKLEHSIPMDKYSSGQYYLKITTADGGLLKSAQITKLK